jgi:ribosome biogenesis ATPase
MVLNFDFGCYEQTRRLRSASRRAGRFDREIKLGIPDLAVSDKILNVQEPQFSFGLFFALNTSGYVEANMPALASKAGLIAVKRYIKTWYSVFHF